MRACLSLIDGSSCTDGTAGVHRPALVRRVAAGLREPVVVVSFWSAIVLPVLYVPLLFNGIASVDRLALFLGLFGLHVLALVGGRRYRRTPG